jgi:hypothetical protein
MANRWKGNFVVAAATTSSGTDYTGKANGAWGLNSQLQQKQAALWAKGVYPPSAPTIGTANAGDSQATVAFTGSSETGGGTITSYTATSTPESITGSSATSPIIVAGLTNGTSYTFTVHANSSLGYVSAESAASNSVTPIMGTIDKLAAGHNTSPYITVYKYEYSVGFISKYANPSTLPNGAIRGAVYASDSASINLASDTSPFIIAYSWSTSGFGSKYADPSTLPPALSYSVAYTPNGTAVGVGHAVSPFLTVYSWSNGFGSKYANPSTLPSGRGIGISFTNSAVSVVTDSGSTFIFTYPWSSGGFGSKYANPSILPGDSCSGVSFSSNGSYLAASFVLTPFLNIYPWSTAGYGTKYSNPSTALSNYPDNLAFSPDNNYVGVAMISSPFINIYGWSTGGFGAKIANPASLPNDSSGTLSFSKNSDSIAVGTASSPFINVYPWSSGFGTKTANPTTTPTGKVNSVAWTI